MAENNCRIDLPLSAFDYRFHITRVCLVTVVIILLFCLVGCQSKIQYPLSEPNANIAKIEVIYTSQFSTTDLEIIEKDAEDVLKLDAVTIFSDVEVRTTGGNVGKAISGGYAKTIKYLINIKYKC